MLFAKVTQTFSLLCYLAVLLSYRMFCALCVVAAFANSSSRKTRSNLKNKKDNMKKLLPLFILIFAASVNAATFTVTRSDDRNAVCISGTDCSLREAINAANASSSNDVINFVAGLTNITMTNEIQINNNGSLVIAGSGADVFTIDGGAGTNRIFYTNIATVTISRVTLTGGGGSGAFADGSGGAVFVRGGSLVLDSVHITSNSAKMDNNTGSGFGGGVYYFASGPDRITNTTFSANRAFACGGFITNGTLTVVNSTISGNTAVNGGGGFCNSLGSNATYTDVVYGDITLRNATITNNTALFGGGIYNSATLNFSNSIIASNNLTYLPVLTNWIQSP